MNGTITLHRQPGGDERPLFQQYEVQRGPGYAMATQGLARFDTRIGQWQYLPCVPDRQPQQYLTAQDLHQLADALDRLPTSNDATPSLF